MTAGLVFRDAGPWGAGKGANLTPAEVDGNFWEMIQRVVALESDPPDPNSIANIVVTGASFTVFLDDGTPLGPFTLPTAVFSWRGTWTAVTEYFALDVFRVPGDGVYLVTTGFESGTAFDPDDGNVQLLVVDGAIGSSWHAGSGAPGAGLGGEGDFYLDLANGDVYEHLGTSGWALVGNIAGPSGAAGADGVDGVDGSQILTGSGAPAGGLGQAGDFYLDTGNGDYYQHLGSAGWTLQGNLTGPAGADGVSNAEIFFGSGAPAGGLGVEGDAYFDVASGDAYSHEGTAGWVLQGTLPGSLATLDAAGDVDYGTSGPQAGDVLVRVVDSSGGRWEPRAPAGGGGQVFIASIDADNSSPNIDFTQFDSGQFDSYMFVLGNLVPATDGDNFGIRTSGDGGSSYDAGASDYNLIDMQTTGGAFSDRQALTNRISLEAAVTVGAAAGEDGVSGLVHVFMPHLAKRTHVKYEIMYQASNGNLVFNNGQAYRTAAAAVDALRFFFGTGNVASGTITMYGLRNG